MFRDNYKKYVPTCPKTIPVVDQYMWKDRDTNQYNCNNGVSHAIYDCQGNVSYTLPLDMYPPGGDIHPQIPLSNRMHFNYRMSPDIVTEVRDVLREGNVEGYEGGSRTNPIQHQLLDQGMFDMRTPSFFRGNVEGYEGGSHTNDLQHPLLDQGMFDMRTPAYFRQERYTPQRQPQGIMSPSIRQHIPDDRQPTEGYDARDYIPRNTYNQGTYNPGYVRDYPKNTTVPEEGPFSSLKALQPYNLEHFQDSRTPPPPPLIIGQRRGVPRQNVREKCVPTKYSGPWNVSDPCYTRDDGNLYCRQPDRPYLDCTTIVTPVSRREGFDDPYYQKPISPFNFCHAAEDGSVQCSEGFSQIPSSSSEFPLVYQSPIMVKGHTMGNPYGNRPGSECKGLYGGV